MVRRGRRVRTPVLAATALLGLLAGCTPASSAPPPSPPPPASAHSALEILVHALGDASFEAREDAERRLTALAPRHYETLILLRDAATDLEIQARLDKILAAPRVIFAAAWVRAEADGVLDTALGESWFQVEHEEVPVGYQRLLAARATREGKPVLRFEMEFEGDFQGDYVHHLITYDCDADLNPLTVHAVTFPQWGEGLFTVHGVRQGDGWLLSASGVGKPPAESRLAWTDRDFPYEAAVPLLPLWVRLGKPGREVVQGDIEFPSMILKTLILRDEGEVHDTDRLRRVSMRSGDDDKPRASLLIGKDGRIAALLTSDNLKGTRVDAEKGRRLRAAFDTLRAKAAEPAAKP